MTFADLIRRCRERSSAAESDAFDRQVLVLEYVKACNEDEPEAVLSALIRRIEQPGGDPS